MKNVILINGRNVEDFLAHTLEMTAANTIKRNCSISQIIEILTTSKYRKNLKWLTAKVLIEYVIRNRSYDEKHSLFVHAYFEKMTEKEQVFTIRALIENINNTNGLIFKRFIGYLNDKYDDLDAKLKRLKLNEKEISYINGFRVAIKLSN